MYQENRPLVRVMPSRPLTFSSRLSLLFSFIFLLSGFYSIAQTNKFETTGNVGIGTLSPAEQLHVYRPASAASYNPIVFLEEGYTTGYVMLGFKGTGRQFNIGIGNGSETAFGLANKFFIWDATAATHRFVLNSSGNIGIGTNNPTNRLSIYSSTANASGLQFSRLNSTTATSTPSGGKVLSLDASGNVILVQDGVGTAGWSTAGNSSVGTSFIGTTSAEDLILKTNASERLRIFSNGNISIGSITNSGKRLEVNGTSYFSDAMAIGTTASPSTDYKLFVGSGIRARKVKVDQLNWPDYVFEPSYRLRPLEEVKAFIESNGHLPGFESAKVVEAEGLDIGTNQAAIVEKVEELTLYIIQLNEQLKAQQKVIQALQEQINATRK